MFKRTVSNRTRLAATGAAVAAMGGIHAMAQTPASDATPIGSPMASPVVDGDAFRTIADEMFAVIQDQYAVGDGSGMYRPFVPANPDDRQYSYLWPYSALLSALGVRARYWQTDEATNDFVAALDGLEMYFDPEIEPQGYDSYPPVDGGGDKFYDDNQWLGQDFHHAYRLTGDQKYLDRSLLIWDFSMSGWSDAMGGGIYWKQYDISTKNTCSNGPAAIHAMMLFEDTGDEQYLDWAVTIMDWLNQLYDPAEGVYSDNIHVEGHINPTKWTYNTGTPMETAALLYQATQDQSWLDQARSLAQSSLMYFAPNADENGVRDFPDSPWFNAVLQRGYDRLYDVDPGGGRQYIDALPAFLARAWPVARNANGLLNKDWAAMQPVDAPMDLLEQAAVIEIAAHAVGYAGK